MLLVKGMVLFFCEKGTLVLREETVHSNWVALGIKCFNIREPSHGNPFHTLRTGTFSMKLLSFDLNL
ncbi:hypothetical protein Lal_00021009 [Lupinus albus]|nr:hypothetical protein Lal_00021009 [Lupinus albus]